MKYLKLLAFSIICVMGLGFFAIASYSVNMNYINDNSKNAISNLQKNC